MDIKLRARLSAYAKIETLDRPVEDLPDHSCNLVPVSKECIDDLFRTGSQVPSEPQQPVAGKEFIDALF